MTTKTVTWCSTEILTCTGKSGPGVFICLKDAALINGGFVVGDNECAFLDGFICGVFINQNCPNIYTYTFSYDDTQLTDPLRLILTSDIDGAFCKGCLTNWVACQILEPFQTCIVDSDTIDFTITDDGCITGDVKISADSGNIISSHSDGIYADVVDTITHLTADSGGTTTGSPVILAGGTDVTTTRVGDTITIGFTPSSGVVTSVTAGNTTLTISPTTGAVIAALNLANANNFTNYQNSPKIVYVSTGGNDANTGLNTGQALATLTAANTKLQGRGEIVILGGDYLGLKLDLGTVINLKIRAEVNNRVRVFFGEKHTSAFVNHAGNVWKKVITQIIPTPFVYPTVGENPFVFEVGTPEGAITQATQHPSQKNRSFRLENFRLKQVANIGAVVAGTYFYDSGTSTLYFERTDAANPNSVGSGIYIPIFDNTANASFVYGATGTQEIEINDIQVYYGYGNFDVRACKKVVTHNIVAFGGGLCGLWDDDTGWSEHWYPEYAASSADGHPVTGSNTTVLDITGCQSFDYFPWGHDCGDQAITYHTNSWGKVIGGLIESNEDGGIFGGGNVECQGVYSRNNIITGFGVTIGAGTGGLGVNMCCTGCISENDQNGFYGTATNGRILINNCYVSGATQAAFTANAGNILDVNNCFVSNNAALTAGGGTINIDACSLAKYAPIVVSDDSYTGTHFQAHSTLTDGYFGIDSSAQLRITSTRELYTIAGGEISFLAYPNERLAIYSTGSTYGYQFLVGPNTTNALTALISASGAVTLTSIGSTPSIALAGTGLKFGIFGATPVVQQTDGATLTNNVTVGGTTNTIADFTDLTIYANDAAAIRNDIYQLARKVKILTDALRALGFTT